MTDLSDRKPNEFTQVVASMELGVTAQVNCTDWVKNLGGYQMFLKMIGSLLDRHKLESVISTTAQNRADIAYLAMMADVELDSDSDEKEMENDVQEV